MKATVMLALFIVCHGHFRSPGDYWRLEWNAEARHGGASPGPAYQQDS